MLKLAFVFGKTNFHKIGFDRSAFAAQTPPTTLAGRFD